MQTDLVLANMSTRSTRTQALVGAEEDRKSVV